MVESRIVGRALEAELGQVVAEHFGGAIVELAGGGQRLGQPPAHPHRLGPLSGKQKGDFAHAACTIKLPSPDSSIRCPRPSGPHNGRTSGKSCAAARPRCIADSTTSAGGLRVVGPAAAGPCVGMSAFWNCHRFAPTAAADRLPIFENLAKHSMLNPHAATCQQGRGTRNDLPRSPRAADGGRSREGRGKPLGRASQHVGGVPQAAFFDLMQQLGPLCQKGKTKKDSLMRRSNSQLRRNALAIWQAGLAAVASHRLVGQRHRVEGGNGRRPGTAPLESIGRIVVRRGGQGGRRHGGRRGRQPSGPRLAEEKQLAGWSMCRPIASAR